MNNGDYVIELNHHMYEDASIRRSVGSIPNRKTNKYTAARLSIKRSNAGQIIDYKTSNIAMKYLLIVDGLIN